LFVFVAPLVRNGLSWPENRSKSDLKSTGNTVFSIEKAQFCITIATLVAGVRYAQLQIPGEGHLLKNNLMIANRKFLTTFFLFNILLWSSACAQQVWSLLDNYPSGVKTCLAGLNDSIMLTGTSKGIYRSGDYGKHWKRPLVSSAVYNIYASGSGKVVAGGIGKVFFSLDKGITWDSVDLKSEFIVKQFAETSQGEFFLITGILDERGFEGDGVFFSSGNLSQWQKRNQGLPFSSNYCESIAIDRKDRLYLGVADSDASGKSGLFISDDKGEHWQHVPLKIANLGTTRVENLTCINVTPEDSVIVSSNGGVSNYGYVLNVIKHRDDVMNTSSWKALRVWNTNIWWMDKLINKIYYSKKREWYTSITGSINIGGSYKSVNKGTQWTQVGRGLGLAITNRYEQQFFHETADGRLFMVQHLDERMYMLTGIDRPYFAVSGYVKDVSGKGLDEVVAYGLGAAVFTHVDGKFTLTVPQTSTGSLSFVKTNYRFSPRITIDNLSRDTSNIQVLAIPNGSYIIKGSVKTSNNLPMPEIRIEGLQTPVATDPQGNFIIQFPAGWSGSIKPVSEGYQFQPAQWQIQDLQHDNLFQQFDAQLITGVSEDEATPLMDVFPNPSSNGLFTLAVRNTNNFVVSIWACNGMKLHETRMISSDNWIEKWEAPEPGVYLVKIQTDKTHKYLRIVSYGR
jgi:hypothetical protein